MISKMKIPATVSPMEKNRNRYKNLYLHGDIPFEDGCRVIVSDSGHILSITRQGDFDRRKSYLIRRIRRLKNTSSLYLDSDIPAGRYEFTIVNNDEIECLYGKSAD